MTAKEFVKKISDSGIKNIIGVPDSTLAPFCNYICKKTGEDFIHYVSANEGSAVGQAIGSYLVSGEPACVYMQNSGLGNIVNPMTSLANKEVYNIPMLLIIGWRGEPGKQDEPQHKYMGKITTELLKLLNIEYSVLDKSMTEEEVNKCFGKAREKLGKHQQYALVVKKNFFEENNTFAYQNHYKLVREEAIKEILQNIGMDDVVVSTTGKISREVYEQSEGIRGNHSQCFLTVGGMGQASMIALGIAKENMNKRVYCIDGDGSILMHMGNLAFIGRQNPVNMVHICLNNDVHESVGGIPTGGCGIDYEKIAKACGYPCTYMADNDSQLQKVLKEATSRKELTFIEIKVNLQVRKDLGRPKESAEENKIEFMRYHAR